MDKDLVLKEYTNKELEKKFKKAQDSKHTLFDFFNEFIHQFISPQTKRAYLKDLNQFFSFLKSGGVIISHPSQIRSFHFQYYRDKLIEDGLASSTINRRLVAIRSFIKWSMALKLIDHNPLDAIKLPKIITEKPTLALDDDEVIRLINAPDGRTQSGAMHRMAIVLLFSLGLRRSELIMIKVQDIYKDRKHYILKIHGKGAKIRQLPLAGFVMDELDAYTQTLLGHGHEFKPESYLLQSKKSLKTGKNIDGTTIYRIIEKYARDLGISKRISPHSARATAISHLLDTQKTAIREVAIFAGHANITTTERYDKRRSNLDHSAAYKVDYQNLNSKKA